ncbi:hypothetical protein T459_27965 [Capsicum annuum]|uniref:Uncharacterized protein n=1 Tax=Capsicum annuum TaxID=4072 RepID=A0A2G2YFF1_CAPAN|nr:hypothetical protein T459_27965 [Capsicum annuum]
MLLLFTYLHKSFLLARQLFISPKLVNLQITPDWRQALTLKKTIEEKITKDEVIGIDIATATVGVLVGGIAAALARKN